VVDPDCNAAVIITKDVSSNGKAAALAKTAAPATPSTSRTLCKRGCALSVFFP
jgi:hypothetical protein